MYSNKFATKLMNTRQLCKEDVEKLSIFIVLSTYYLTFRIQNKIFLAQSNSSVDAHPVTTIRI